MPTEPDNDDHDPADRLETIDPGPSWLAETQSAVLDLVDGMGPKQRASAETAARLLGWLESGHEPDWVRAVPDGRTLRIRWSSGPRKLIVAIVAGKPHDARKLLGDAYGPVVRLRGRQALDTLRGLMAEMLA